MNSPEINENKSSLSTQTDIPELRRSSSFMRTLSSSDSSGLIKLLEDNILDQHMEKLEESNTLKMAILDSIGQFESELDKSYSAISEQAQEHIHTNEVIMTYGKSKTVEHFLKTTAVHRRFEVIVVEDSPENSGYEMAKSLSSCENIKVIVITDASLFALISRVHKVIIGTYAVMANGGLIATSGISNLVHAAKYHSVPLVVCTALYKLSPLYAHDCDTFNELKASSEILSFEIGQKLDVSAINPAWDYIPPEFESPPTPIREGWLSKKGNFKSFRRRWFVLRGNTATYYSDPSLKIKKGEFSLSNMRVSAIEIPDRPHCIKLIPDAENTSKFRSYTLCTSLKEDQIQWINALVKSIFWSPQKKSPIVKDDSLSLEVKGVLDNEYCINRFKIFLENIEMTNDGINSSKFNLKERILTLEGSFDRSQLLSELLESGYLFYVIS